MKNIKIDLKINDLDAPFRKGSHSKIKGLDVNEAEKTIKMLKKKYS